METIETARLLVRNFRPDDAPSLRQRILQYQASEYAAYDHEWPTGEKEIQGVTESSAARRPPNGRRASCWRDLGSSKEERAWGRCATARMAGQSGFSAGAYALSRDEWQARQGAG